MKIKNTKIQNKNQSNAIQIFGQKKPNTTIELTEVRSAK